MHCVKHPLTKQAARLQAGHEIQPKPTQPKHGVQSLHLLQATASSLQHCSARLLRLERRDVWPTVDASSVASARHSILYSTHTEEIHSLSLLWCGCVLLQPKRPRVVQTKGRPRDPRLPCGRALGRAPLPRTSPSTFLRPQLSMPSRDGDRLKASQEQCKSFFDAGLSKAEIFERLASQSIEAKEAVCKSLQAVLA